MISSDTSLHKLYRKQRRISTGNKKLSTFFPQKQAKKGDFSVLSRIFLLHRQENLRKGLTIGEKFDKIQTDHIRTIWRIGIIRSAGARHAGRESAVQRICVLRRNRRRGRCVLCSAVFFPLLRPSASAPGQRRGKGPAGEGVREPRKMAEKVSGRTSAEKPGPFGTGFAIFAKSCHILRRNA